MLFLLMFDTAGKKSVAFQLLFDTSPIVETHVETASCFLMNAWVDPFGSPSNRSVWWKLCSSSIPWKSQDSTTATGRDMSGGSRYAAFGNIVGSCETCSLCVVHQHLGRTRGNTTVDE